MPGRFNCIFWLQLIPSANGAIVGKSFVNCDAAQYQAADVVEERQRLKALLDAGVLER